MTQKREIPTLINLLLKEEYFRVATLIKNEYKKEVYRVMHSFKLLDDYHIEKYLHCTSMKAIFDDALEKNAAAIDYLEQQRLFSDLDVWKNIRDPKSPVTSPTLPGFIFRKLPRADYGNREILVNALKVKDGIISIDKEALEKAAIITPTPEQVELYQLVADFCEGLKEKNIENKTLSQLLCNFYGQVVPNSLGIFGLLFGDKLE